MSKYYSVSVNGTWTKDAETADFYEKAGSKVQPSRRVGDMDVFIQGRLVAHLFENKEDQLAYLKELGLI